MRAIKPAAARKKLARPTTPSLAATLEPLTENNPLLFRNHLNTTPPGLPQKAAQDFVDALHNIRPNSKTTRGNIAEELSIA
jgi:organic hydroperoxide reductase OsmC/OhrA